MDKELVTIKSSLLDKLKELNIDNVETIPLTGEHTSKGLILNNIVIREQSAERYSMRSKPSAGKYAPIAITQIHGENNMAIQLQENMWSCFNLKKIPTGEDYSLIIYYCDTDDYY